MDWFLYLLEKLIHNLRLKLRSVSQITPNRFTNRKIIKLDLGCGGVKQKGFIGIDAILGPRVDLEYNLELGIPFPENSISEIYTSHFLEHLPDQKALFLLKEIKRVLQTNGKLTIVVPDLESSMQKFLKMSEKDKWSFGWQWIFGNQKKEYEFHKTGFSKNRIKNLLKKNKFKNIKIESSNKNVPSLIIRATI